MTRDVRHAARGLWRSPGFSLAVILTLALGIGGNTAVFSVVDQLLLRPLPYPDGDQLVMVDELSRLNSRADVSPANWLDWQRESRTFRRFAAWRGWSFTLTGAGEPRRVNAQQVSSEFFPLLGVAPLLGRTISDEDDRPNGPRVAVLSYRAWQDQLGGNRRAMRYPDERPRDFYREALTRLRALPGIESAAVAASLPMIGIPRGGTRFHELGTPERPRSDMPSTVVRMVAPGYFHTLRIPVLRGREFTDADNANPMAGFVVNETFARRYLSGRDPLATSISVRMQAENPHLPIIGVVGDVSEGSVRVAPQPTVFYSHGRMPWTTMTLFVRGRQPKSLVKPVTAALHELDPTLAVSNVRTIERALAESLARERISALISTSFGVGGLLLAALGLYGLLAYLVAERTKDIGIRIALGARLASVTRSVVRNGLVLVGIGAVIGIAGSLLLLRSLGTLLFGVTPYDVPTHAIVVTLLGAIAALASYLPARRAARIEPLTALRHE